MWVWSQDPEPCAGRISLAAQTFHGCDEAAVLWKSFTGEGKAQGSSCSFKSGRTPALYEGDGRANEHQNRRLDVSCRLRLRSLQP